jgi:hypothetical protein
MLAGATTGLWFCHCQNCNYSCAADINYGLSRGHASSRIQKAGLCGESRWIHGTLRLLLGIPIHTRPIDEAEGVGLRVAADGGIVAPVPVVMQAGFELEPRVTCDPTRTYARRSTSPANASGETRVEGGAADNAVPAAPSINQTAT